MNEYEYIKTGCTDSMLYWIYNWSYRLCYHRVESQTKFTIGRTDNIFILNLQFARTDDICIGWYLQFSLGGMCNKYTIVHTDINIIWIVGYAKFTIVSYQ